MSALPVLDGQIVCVREEPVGEEREVFAGEGDLWAGVQLSAFMRFPSMSEVLSLAWRV